MSRIDRIGNVGHLPSAALRERCVPLHETPLTVAEKQQQNLVVIHKPIDADRFWIQRLVDVVQYCLNVAILIQRRKCRLSDENSAHNRLRSLQIENRYGRITKIEYVIGATTLLLEMKIRADRVDGHFGSKTSAWRFLTQRWAH
jgi:hypothetical protein